MGHELIGYGHLRDGILFRLLLICSIQVEKLFFSNIPMEINIEFYSIVIGMLYAPSSTFAHKEFLFGLFRKRSFKHTKKTSLKPENPNEKLQIIFN